MTSSKFDAFTKALATAGSRRQALKAIGVALGGALGLGRFGIAFAKDCSPIGHPCGHANQRPCCSGVCDHYSHTCVAGTTGPVRRLSRW
jgi:hypothetical protein